MKNWKTKQYIKRRIYHTETITSFKKVFQKTIFYEKTWYIFFGSRAYGIDKYSLLLIIFSANIHMNLIQLVELICHMKTREQIKRYSHTLQLFVLFWKQCVDVHGLKVVYTSTCQNDFFHHGSNKYKRKYKYSSKWPCSKIDKFVLIKMIFLLLFIGCFYHDFLWK